MILVDTSVWVDHLRRSDGALRNLLEAGTVLAHPFVIGELALGNLRQRGIILNYLHDLPQTVVAMEQEVLHFISQHTLFGQGIGYVDAHLLASVWLTQNAALWTRDTRLHRVAEQLRVAARLT
jgi:predicted nucleic acid-binding protein